MKYLEDLSRRGYIEIVIRFDGYAEYYQNRTRQDLTEKIPKYIRKQLKGRGGISIEPLDYRLLRRVVAKTGRAIGGSSLYRYKVENSEDIPAFIKAFKAGLKKYEKDYWAGISSYFLETLRGLVPR